MKDKSLNNYLESQGLSAGSIRRYGKIIERFESWREAEGMPLSLISYSDLLAFVKSLSTYSRSYQSQHLAALRYYFGYLQSNGKVSHNPATGFILRGPKRRAPHNLISQAQLAALYEAYPAEKPVQKAMLSLILFQALRREELAVLTPDQVELRKGQIRIPATRRANARTLKLAAHQVLDLSTYLQDIRPKLLAALPKPTKKLFFAPKGSNRIDHMLAKIRAQLKETNPAVHSFGQIRQSVITEWLRTGELRDVQYRAGHKYVSSTERYRVEQLEKLQKQLNKYHPLG